MENYIISERAKKDLIGIWDYTIKEWSEEQAERYVNSNISFLLNIGSLLGFYLIFASLMHLDTAYTYRNFFNHTADFLKFKSRKRGR